MESAIHDRVTAARYVVALLVGRIIGPKGNLELQPRPLELCMALAANGRAMRAMTLSELLYPELDEVSGHRRLRVYACRLRQRIPGALAPSQHRSYALSPAVVTDLEELESWARSPGYADPANADGILRALRLLLQPRDGYPFDRWPWFEPTEARIAALLSDSITALLRMSLTRSQAETAIPLARLAIRQDPYNELAHRLLIRALQALGRKACALRAYREYDSMLRDELDLSAPRDLCSLVSELV
jgi:DNA-binding SARP family transcriptional activator